MHLIDLQGFLSELRENNQRAWMAMNRPRYDILRKEFLEFVTDLIGTLGKTDPEIADCNPAKALFRINRDIRFSQDKSPYKTTFSASVIPNGRKKPSDGGGPAYYFHFNADGQMLFAAGEYIPPPARLKQIRHHLISDGDRFLQAVHSPSFTAHFRELLAEGKLVRPPKGFPADHPMADWLKYKSFIAVQESTYQGTSSAEIMQQLCHAYQSAQPFIHWLRSCHE